MMFTPRVAGRTETRGAGQSLPWLTVDGRWQGCLSHSARKRQGFRPVRNNRQSSTYLLLGAAANVERMVFLRRRRDAMSVPIGIALSSGSYAGKAPAKVAERLSTAGLGAFA